MTELKARNWAKKFYTLLGERDVILHQTQDRGWGLQLLAVSDVTYTEEFQMKDLWTLLNTSMS